MKNFFHVLVFVLLVSALPSFSHADSASQNYNLGLSLFSKNEFEHALAHFLEAADENFNSWQAYQMAGYCYYEMQDKGSALEAFGESLKINPANARLAKVYNNLKEGAAVLPLRPVVDAGGFLPGT